MIAFATVVVATLACTWLAGWWGVVLVALVAGALLWQRPAASWLVSLAAATAWAALLVVDAAGGRFAALASSVGGVMRIPAGALIAVTLLFAALLAWSAAVVGGDVARLARRTPRASPSGSPLSAASDHPRDDRASI